MLCYFTPSPPVPAIRGFVDKAQGLAQADRFAKIAAVLKGRVTMIPHF
jgi:hypothetical protein